MGNILKSCRKEQGLTQRELSLKSGISRTVISKIEQDKKNTNVHTQTLAALAKALDKKVDEIFFV